MWNLAAAGCSLVALLLVVRRFRELDDLPTQVLLLGIWARFLLQAFPEITVTTRVAGFSLIALASMATIGAMIVAMDRSLLRLRFLGPIYALLGVIVLSAVVNAAVVGVIDVVTKWLFYVCIVLLVFRGALLHGPDRILRGLLCAMSAPPMLLIASVAMGKVKATELDGSISYIGGFYHEVIFSTALLMFLTVSALIRWRSRAAGVGLIVFAIVGIVLTNYRTTLIATLPLLATISFWGLVRGIPRPTRLLGAAALALAAVGVAPLAWNALPERYADIATVASDIDLLAKEPLEFTVGERRIFSGRIFIWSSYLDAVEEGDVVSALIGHGPNKSSERFFTLAHNAFLTYLFEFGALGLIGITVLFLTGIFLALKIQDRRLASTIAAAQLCFVVFNLSSNGLSSVEGYIFYGVVIGLTFAEYVRSVDQSEEQTALKAPRPSGEASQARAT